MKRSASETRERLARVKNGRKRAARGEVVVTISRTDDYSVASFAIATVAAVVMVMMVVVVVVVCARRSGKCVTREGRRVV